MLHSVEHMKLQATIAIEKHRGDGLAPLLLDACNEIERLTAAQAGEVEDADDDVDNDVDGDEGGAVVVAGGDDESPDSGGEVSSPDSGAGDA